MRRRDAARLLAGLLLAGVALGALAQQDFEEYKRQQEEKFRSYQQEHDRRFAEFLRQEWEKFEAFAAASRDPHPKLAEPPVAPERPTAEPELEPEAPAPEEDAPDLVPPEPIRLPPPPPPPRPEPEEELPVVAPEPDAAPEVEQPPSGLPEAPPPPPPAPSTRRIELDFYGRTVQLDWPEEADQVRLGGELESEAITAWYEAMGATPAPRLAPTLQGAGERLALNDWGFLMLLHEMAGRIRPASEPEQTLLTWFLLQASGFDARVGYSDEELVLLLPFRQMVFATTYYELGSRRYFAVPLTEAQRDRRTGSLYTYEGGNPEAERELDLRFQRVPALPDIFETRRIEVSLGGREHTVRARFNRKVVDFWRLFPQTELEVYFTGAVSARTLADLAEGLKPVMEGRSEVEAVQVLLRFMHEGFPYQVDDKQFGYEKCMFPEEVLYYPYSDCEDRSALFATLVRDLAGLEVVGLDYPGHVATAVAFSNPVPGDAVMVAGRRYVVCDPTYINSRVGQAMPAYRQREPVVIRL